MVGPSDRKRKRSAWRTVWAVGAAQAVDAGENNIVSSMFPSIERALGLNVGHLGTILMARHAVGLIAGPVWSMLADRYSRKAILVWVTGMWGIWTLVVGFSGSYRYLLALTILSGLGLFARTGAKRALVADQFPETARGRAFGSIWAIAAAGAVIGSLVFGTLAQVSSVGWRIAYWTFGGLSVVSGALIWFLVEEPRRGQSEAALAGTESGTADELEARHRFALRRIPSLLKIPTLWTVWLSGIAEQFVWVGVVNFGATWLADERGLSPGLATYGVGALTIGLGLGGLFGGRVGDWLDRRNPGTGRAVLGHLAKVMAVITAYAMFRMEWEGYLAHWALFGALGLWITVSDSGASVPMSIAVTLPEVRATASAVGGIVAGIAAAVASSVIGQLGVRLGLTATLLWVVTGAALAQVLIWIVCYAVYRRDAAKVQRILGERLVELTAKAQPGDNS